MGKNTLDQDVDKLRPEIARICDEIDWIAEAPVPRDELKARAAKGCHELAAKFEAARYLGALAKPTGSMGGMFAATANVFTRGGGAEVSLARIDDIGPMLAWMAGDALIERMHASIDAMDYRPGPPLAERPARLAKLQAELRELEMKEEALIVAAEEAGMLIARRPDASPEVVLGFDPAGDMIDGARTVSIPAPARVRNAERSAPVAAPARSPAHYTAPASMGPVDFLQPGVPAHYAHPGRR